MTVWKPWRRRAEGGKITPGLKYVPVAGSSDLWWVKVILNVGRPVVAVFVLVMCAPGEHYLARKAGWSEWLAWGMPATLTAYAGIAAVVATKRPKGAPGKATAVWGAIVSVLLAMAAQPVAHLYGKTGLDAQQITLTVIVSCIPALVFGHLLHMAAAPVVNPLEQAAKDLRDHISETFDVPRDMLGTDVPAHGPRSQASPEDESVEDGEALDYSPDAFEYRAGDERRVTEEALPGTYSGDAIEDNASIDYLRGQPGPASWDGDTLRRDAQDMINLPRPTAGLWIAPVGTGAPDNGDTPAEPWEPVPGVTGATLRLVPGDTVTSANGIPRPRRRTGDTGVTPRVRDVLRDKPSATDEEIKDTFEGEDIPRNSINKAIRRVRRELEEETTT